MNLYGDDDERLPVRGIERAALGIFIGGAVVAVSSLSVGIVVAVAVYHGFVELVLRPETGKKGH